MSEFTTEDLEAIVVGAVKAGDMKAIEAALRVMATQDPHRAEELMETMLLGLAVAKDMREVEAKIAEAAS